MVQEPNELQLPSPNMNGELSLEQLLRLRRSMRVFSRLPVSLIEVGQLLWAAQGITSREGFRSAPSAGACYPLELVLVAGEVEQLPAGTYRYRPDGHRLQRMLSADQRKALTAAVPGQEWLRQAAVIIVIAANHGRSTVRYGSRGHRYVYIEAGHAAENLFLQAESMGLATVVVGAFDDRAVAAVLSMPKSVHPVLVMPVGCH